jgi:hypothetical protein
LKWDPYEFTQSISLFKWQETLITSDLKGDIYHKMATSIISYNL